MHSTDARNDDDCIDFLQQSVDMHAFGTSLIDLILGRSCAGCDEPGVLLCQECTRVLRPCVRLRRDLDVSDVMAGLRIPVVCALDYAGATRQVLYRYKDHRIRQLANALSPALAAAISFAAVHTGTDLKSAVLTPLPTRRSSVRRRGFDATSHVTRCASRLISTGGITPLLVDVRSSGSTKRGGALERQQQVVAAFQPLTRLRLGGHEPPSQPVILVDDIVTTGATARAAAETLLFAGVHVAAVATIAGTP